MNIIKLHETCMIIIFLYAQNFNLSFFSTKVLCLSKFFGFCFLTVVYFVISSVPKNFFIEDEFLVENFRRRKTKRKSSSYQKVEKNFKKSLKVNTKLFENDSSNSSRTNETPAYHQWTSLYNCQILIENSSLFNWQRKFCWGRVEIFLELPKLFLTIWQKKMQMGLHWFSIFLHRHCFQIFSLHSSLFPPKN